MGVGQHSRSISLKSQEEKRSRKPQPGTVPKGGAVTILVMDGEDSVRDMIRRMFTQAGHKLLTACDGKEGLDLYKRESAKISLVILELMRPYVKWREINPLLTTVRDILDRD